MKCNSVRFIYFRNVLLVVDCRAQTSVEMLLLVAGIVLVVLLLGYYLISSAGSVADEVNRVAHS